VYVFALTSLTAACWESSPRLSQSQKPACAVPADKKTAKNAAKKPIETIFLKLNILFINILTINAK
jgi:hypothetical protein